MRIVKLCGSEMPIKANQAAKQRYLAEFGTSLTHDLTALIKPLVGSGLFTTESLEDIDSQTVVAMLLSLDVDVQDVLVHIFWACAWAANRSIEDFDQWADRVQDVDESALSLLDGTEVSSWAIETVKAVSKAFLGIDLDESLEALTIQR